MIWAVIISYWTIWAVIIYPLANFGCDYLSILVIWAAIIYPFW
jgi:hypothetical protein